ncbi:MAG TPA: hypoxanthine-guanine phosphoribosyltransferase [Gammaproteobacteria bacterium]|jgi:hypoxanthine phosphoribosyltransferase|nr:hypoxanthine-guanine phosphoribosyltransferase [Gammaproteobacteria bacterium]
MSNSLEQARQVLQEADELYSVSEVDAAFEDLARRISACMAADNPLFLCVLTGAIIPAGQLLTRLDFPLEVDYLHATRYRGETRGRDLQWIARPQTPLKGRVVAVVDDILDEGHTLAAILDYCRQEGAAAVYSVVLVDKQHDRRVPGLKADFHGLVVEDRYVFGQGMDYKGYHRNLPGIYAVRGH